MKRELNKISNTEYEVLIVGAGIYGVSVAWDAALRGLKVAMIDKGDFANATSSNSLKTIHGGLRYLQQLDFRRMRESINERTVLMNIAPHLVHPLPVVMPTYGYKLKSRPAMFFALLANDLIGFDRNKLNDSYTHIPRGHLISKEEVKKYIPGYEKNNMSGGALWYDCQCYNTERLALSYVLSAVNSGADVANYVACKGFLVRGDKVAGVKVKDSLTGDTFDIRAKIVVNTGGPWVDTILSYMNGKHMRKRFNHSLAMNIIVNRKLLNKYAVGLPGPYRYKREDGLHYEGNRILFFSPWRDYTIIGTEHLPYYGSPDDYTVKEIDIQNFLNAVNQAYPAADVKHEDICFFHGGLLPMIRTKPVTGEVELLRHYGIYDHLVDDKINGLITVVGVKYTTHRHVASKTIDIVFRKLGKIAPKCVTGETPIYGGEIARFEDYLTEAIKTSELNGKVTRHLVYNYGSRYKDIIMYGDENPNLLQAIPGSDEVLKVEVLNGVREEMALKLSDVIVRRTDLGSAGNPGVKTLKAAAEIMAKELNWDEARVKKEIDETKTIYVPINNFKEYNK